MWGSQHWNNGDGTCLDELCDEILVGLREDHHLALGKSVTVERDRGYGTTD